MLSAKKIRCDNGFRGCSEWKGKRMREILNFCRSLNTLNGKSTLEI